MSTETKNSPDLIAYTTSGTDEKTYWHKVGSAWANKKDGYNVQLFGLPVNGKIVLLPPRDDDEAE